MLWFRFPREFSSLFRGVTWSVRAPSGNLCCVTSPGKLSSAVVAPWCYGIGTVLDFINGWFPIGEESSGPARVGGRSFAEFQRCSSHVQESQSTRREESARRSRVVLNRPTWPCPRAACRIRLSVWGGAPPPHVQAFWGWEFTWSDIPVIPWKIQTYRFYMLFSHT